MTKTKEGGVDYSYRAVFPKFLNHTLILVQAQPHFDSGGHKMVMLFAVDSLCLRFFRTVSFTFFGC